MPAPLRVCIDLTPCEMRDRFGGFGRYATTLVRHLLALPDEVRGGLELLALARSDEPPTSARQALAASLAGGPIITPWRHHVQRRFLVGRSLRAAGVDLFHATTPAALPYAAGCPIVATVHDIIPAVYPAPGHSLMTSARRALGRIEQRLRLNRADHLLAISETTARDVMRTLGVPPQRITVVRHGVDTALFHPNAVDDEHVLVRRRHGIPGRWFLSVGSDHYRKNHRRLFDAWRATSAEVPEGLVLVGKAIHDGALWPIVEEARRAGLGDRVRWLTDVTDADLPALYRQSSATVAPSLYEGFGMTLLESLACGTPVMASRTDAHVEVGGDAVAYVDPTSVDDMAFGLTQIATDATRRAELRERGLARAAAFTWTQAGRETLDLYRRMVGNRVNR